MVKLTGHVECTYGDGKDQRNCAFYFFLSSIISSVNARCGGIDGNFQKLL